MQLIFSNYDSPDNPYYGGGGALATHEIGKRLAVRHAVTVIAGRYPGATDRVLDGVRYRFIGPSRVGGRLGQLIFQLLLPFEVRRARYDLWIENFIPPFSTLGLQRWTRRPVVGLTTLLNGAEFQRKYKLPFATLERWGLKPYRHLIAQTPAMVEQVQTLNPHARIHMIGLGVDAGLLEMPMSVGSGALYLGRIDIYQKGLDLLLEAWAKLPAQARPRLTIAGGGRQSEVRRLSEMIAERGVAGSIVLTGPVGEARKRELLRGCRFVVMPSRFETFGLVALEALAAGKPVVSFDIPGLSWIPESACDKAPPFDVQCLSTEISKWHQAKGNNALQTAGRAFAEDHTWDAVARQYESCLTQINAQTL